MTTSIKTSIKTQIDRERAERLASKRRTDLAIMRLDASDRAWAAWLAKDNGGVARDALILVAQVLEETPGALATVAHHVGHHKSATLLEVARALVDVVAYRSNMGRGDTTPARLVREYLGGIER